MAPQVRRLLFATDTDILEVFLQQELTWHTMTRYWRSRCQIDQIDEEITLSENFMGLEFFSPQFAFAIIGERIFFNQGIYLKSSQEMAQVVRFVKSASVLLAVAALLELLQWVSSSLGGVGV